MRHARESAIGGQPHECGLVAGLDQDIRSERLEPGRAVERLQQLSPDFTAASEGEEAAIVAAVPDDGGLEFVIEPGGGPREVQRPAYSPVRELCAVNLREQTRPAAFMHLERQGVDGQIRRIRANSHLEGRGVREPWVERLMVRQSRGCVHHHREIRKPQAAGQRAVIGGPGLGVNPTVARAVIFPHQHPGPAATVRR